MSEIRAGPVEEAVEAKPYPAGTRWTRLTDDRWRWEVWTRDHEEGGVAESLDAAREAIRRAGEYWHLLRGCREKRCRFLPARLRRDCVGCRARALLSPGSDHDD